MSYVPPPGVTQLQLNLADDFAGRIWAAVIGIAFVAIYVHCLGVECLLKVFVYYSLAAVVAGGLLIASTPIFDTLFRRFFGLFVFGDISSPEQLIAEQLS